MSSFVPLGSELLNRLHRYGRKIALCDESGCYSHHDLIMAAMNVGQNLLVYGVKPGEPIATCFSNNFLAVAGSYGVNVTGAAEAPIDPRLTYEEKKYLINLIGAHIVICAESVADTFKNLGLRILLVEDLVVGEGGVNGSLGVDGKSWGKIVFTSGTTGKPKAIVHSHERKWLANLLLNACLPPQITSNSRILLMTPFAFGASLLANVFLGRGASVHLLSKVDTEEVEKLLISGEIDTMFAPPTVLAKLTNSFQGKRYLGLKTIFCGTATLTPVVYNEAREMFGPVIRVTYGKSEIHNPITVLDPEECDIKYSRVEPGEVSVGWPAPGVELLIINEAGEIVDGGEQGEVYIRAKHMMVGYVEADGYHSLAPDSWHATGDVARIGPEGDLILIGRKHDLIKTGGYKVFAQEIETIIESADPTAKVVVVGLPSEYWGQIIVAVCEDVSKSTEWSERAKRAVECLASYKRPRAYITFDTLPKGGQDKISRSDVARLILNEYTLKDGPYPQIIPISNGG